MTEFKECDWEFLKELLNTPSPSGYERFGGIEVFKRYCRNNISMVKEEFTDTMGNCAFSIGNDNAPVSIMISGHIDEIGFQISNKTKEGLYRIVSLGGIDKKCMYGQEVEIISSSGKIIPGVIGKTPIHIEWYGDDKDTVPKIKDILIDTGGFGEEDIQIGDPVVYKRNMNVNFGKDCILSKGLDDKIGVFVSTVAFRELSQNLSENIKFGNVKIWCVSNVQEEVGLRGAMRTAKMINPTYSIDIDVTFASDEGRGIDEGEYGDVKLGSGAVIMHGPDKSRDLNRTMRLLAKDNNINFQEIVAGVGGTNTAAIQEFSLNTETTHLGIPLRNMHTPVEVCNKNDLLSAINIILKTIEALKN